MSFVDKEGNTKKPRGSFLIPTVPHRDSKHFAKKGSIVPKVNDAEVTYGNLFVGMWKMYNSLLKSSPC